MLRDAERREPQDRSWLASLSRSILGKHRRLCRNVNCQVIFVVSPILDHPFDIANDEKGKYLMPKPKEITCEREPGRQYVGAKEAAEIAGVDRVRILQLLKDGKYPGAFRDKSGYWVIPLEEAEAVSRQKAQWKWSRKNNPLKLGLEHLKRLLQKRNSKENPDPCAAQKETNEQDAMMEKKGSHEPDFQSGGIDTPKPVESEIEGEISDSLASDHQISTTKRAMDERTIALCNFAPCEESLQLLPLYSSVEIEELNPKDLHAGYKGNTPISELALSLRIKRLLNLMGYHLLGELLIATPQYFTLTDHRQIMEVVRGLLLGNPSMCHDNLSVDTNDKILSHLESKDEDDKTTVAPNVAQNAPLLKSQDIECIECEKLVIVIQQMLINKVKSLHIALLEQRLRTICEEQCSQFDKHRHQILDRAFIAKLFARNGKFYVLEQDHVVVTPKLDKLEEEKQTKVPDRPKIEATKVPVLPRRSNESEEGLRHAETGKPVLASEGARKLREKEPSSHELPGNEITATRLASLMRVGLMLTHNEYGKGRIHHLIQNGKMFLVKFEGEQFERWLWTEEHIGKVTLIGHEDACSQKPPCLASTLLHEQSIDPLMEPLSGFERHQGDTCIAQNEKTSSKESQKLDTEGNDSPHSVSGTETAPNPELPETMPLQSLRVLPVPCVSHSVPSNDLLPDFTEGKDESITAQDSSEFSAHPSQSPDLLKENPDDGQECEEGITIGDASSVQEKEISKDEIPNEEDIGQSDPSFVELINHFGLSTRAKKVLKENVSSIRELLELDRNKLASFPDCGRKSMNEIMELVRNIDPKSVSNLGGIQTSHKGGFDDLMITLSDNPPCEETLDLLPIFSSEKIEYFSEDELHPGYKGSQSISELPFSTRLKKCLNAMGFTTLGKLLLSVDSDLLEYRYFQRSDLREVQKVVRDLLLGLAVQASGDVLQSSARSQLKGVESAIEFEHASNSVIDPEDVDLTKSQCSSCDIALDALEEILTWSECELSVRSAATDIFRKCRDFCPHFKRAVAHDWEEDIGDLLEQINTGWTIKNHMLRPPDKAQPTLDKAPDTSVICEVPQHPRLDGEIEVNCLSSDGEEATETIPQVSQPHLSESISALFSPIGRDLVQCEPPLDEHEVRASDDSKTKRCDSTAAYLLKTKPEKTIPSLPESLAKFMAYLLSDRNNSSYKMVLASIFLDEMDESGSVSITTLRTKMRTYYEERKNAGNIVEAEGSAAAKVGLFKKRQFEQSLIKNPLQSFVSSGYFLFDQHRLWLRPEICSEIFSPDLKTHVLAQLTKATAEYFETLSLREPACSEHLENAILVREDQDALAHNGEGAKRSLITETRKPPEADVASVSIKRKQKTKIEL